MMPHNRRETSNRIVVAQLHKRLKDIEEHFGADGLTVVSPIAYGLDDAVRDAVESRKERRQHDQQEERKALVLLLETTGGYIEVAERIADVFRHHYERIDFVVPNHAFSAGTVLVMSGDAIHMDYYSVLGPIDPQVERPGNPGFVPALGYLAKYKELIEKSQKGDLTTAELAFLVQKFDPAELYSFEQARELSVDLLKRWLVAYKFKHWAKTETRALQVDDAMRQERAEKIARMLNETETWHSHSRGIPLAVLSRDVELRIDDFDKIPGRSDLIRCYYRLLKDYMARVQDDGIIHGYQRYVSLF